MGEKGDRGQPQKLTNWRLTSPDKAALEGAAALYGGTVQPWQGQAGQFELYTTSSEIPILLAPVDMSQWYEEWSAGGCKKRCDGETCQLATADGTQDVPCDCDPDNRTCKMVTRLSVMLPDLPAIGVWRLDTHGFYAASELPTTAETLIRYAKMGRFVPALLAIEQRTVKRNNQTRNFIVPVIRVRETLRDVLAGRSAISLEEGPESLPGAPAALPAPEPVVPAADARSLEPNATTEEPLRSVEDLNVTQETGEIHEPPAALLEVLDSFEVKGVARDYVTQQNPAPDAAKQVFEKIVVMGKSVNAALLKTKGMDPQPNWISFAASIRTAHEAFVKPAAEAAEVLS